MFSFMMYDALPNTNLSVITYALLNHLLHPPNRTKEEAQNPAFCFTSMLIIHQVCYGVRHSVKNWSCSLSSLVSTVEVNGCYCWEQHIILTNVSCYQAYCGMDDNAVFDQTVQANCACITAYSPNNNPIAAVQMVILSLAITDNYILLHKYTCAQNANRIDASFIGLHRSICLSVPAWARSSTRCCRFAVVGLAGDTDCCTAGS